MHAVCVGTFLLKKNRITLISSNVLYKDINVTDFWHPTVTSLKFKMGFLPDYLSVWGYLSSKRKALFWICWKCAIPTYIFPKYREATSFGIILTNEPTWNKATNYGKQAYWFQRTDNVRYCNDEIQLHKFSVPLFLKSITGFPIWEFRCSGKTHNGYWWRGLLWVLFCKLTEKLPAVEIMSYVWKGIECWSTSSLFVESIYDRNCLSWLSQISHIYLMWFWPCNINNMWK